MGNARRAAVARLCGASDGTLRLRFPAEDLGFVYGQNEDGEEDGRSEKMNRRGSPARSPPGSSATPRASCRRGRSRRALGFRTRACASKTAGLENADASTLDLVECVVADAFVHGASGSGSSQKASRSHGDAPKTDRAPTFAVLVSASAVRNNPETLAALVAWADAVAAACPAGARLRLALIGTEAEATAAAANGANGASAFAEGSDVASLRVAAVDRDGARGRARRARTRCWRGRTGTSRGSGRGGGGGTADVERELRRALGRDAPT